MGGWAPGLPMRGPVCACGYPYMKSERVKWEHGERSCGYACGEVGYDGFLTIYGRIFVPAPIIEDENGPIPGLSLVGPSVTLRMVAYRTRLAGWAEDAAVVDWVLGVCIKCSFGSRKSSR